MACKALQSVNISENVTSIGNGTFSSCELLSDIYIDNAEGVISGARWGAPESAKITYLRELRIEKNIEEYTYNGKAVTPDIVIRETKDSESRELTEGTDYILSYSDNVNAGTALARVEYINIYSNLGTVDIEFIIYPKSALDVNIAPIGEKVFTGNEITPQLTVTDNIREE